MHHQDIPPHSGRCRAGKADEADQEIRRRSGEGLHPGERPPMAGGAQIKKGGAPWQKAK